MAGDRALLVDAGYAAVAAGINVKKIKYQALFINGVLCGLGGAELALSVHMFNVGMTNGRGYTALAAIILSNSSPLVCILAIVLFFQYILSKYQVHYRLS